MSAAVEIVIDELVLRGVDPVHAPAVTTALHRRLVQLASASSVDWSPYTRELLLARRVRAPTDSPAQLGQRIADAVWSSVTNSARVAR